MPIGCKTFLTSLNSFDPRHYDLALWLDAADAGTLYDATTGGNLVAPDGTVARWEDKSGNGYHAIQATSSNRPTRKASEKNGLDALLFDGSTDILLGDYQVDGGDLFLVFECRRDSASSARYTTMFITGPSGQGCRILQKGETGNDFFATWGGAPYYGTTVIDNGVDGIAGLSEDGNFGSGANTELRLNGAVENANANSTGFNTAPDADKYDVGGDRTYGRRFSGLICEIISFPNKLSNHQRAKVERYLALKWGIALA